MAQDNNGHAGRVEQSMSKNRRPNRAMKDHYQAEAKTH